MVTTNGQAKADTKDDPHPPTNKVAMEAARRYCFLHLFEKCFISFYLIFAFILMGIVISLFSEPYSPIEYVVLYIVFYALFLFIFFYVPPYPLITPSNFDCIIGRLRILEEETYELYNIHPKHCSERFKAAVSVDFQYQKLEADIRTKALELSQTAVENGERYIVEEYEIPYMFIHGMGLLLDVALVLRRQAIEQSARHIAEMSEGKLRERAVRNMWLEFTDVEAHINKSSAFENGTCLKLETYYPVKRQFVALNVAYNTEELRSNLAQKVPLQAKSGTAARLRAWRSWLNKKFVILFFGYPYRLRSKQFHPDKSLSRRPLRRWNIFRFERHRLSDEENDIQGFADQDEKATRFVENRSRQEDGKECISDDKKTFGKWRGWPEEWCVYQAPCKQDEAIYEKS